ncbi:MAG: efflux RND transporter periplasmic adaptor subunit [Planctomycetes bacterium]|nr:efflux RND transporter periplasmic adaptor subunit [Planctomycetota bacterium]
MKTFLKASIALLILAAMAFGLWSFIKKKQGMMVEYQAMAEAQMAPKPVTVDTPFSRTVTEYYKFTGTAEAFEAVDVRARVSGYLQSIEFKDGAEVEAGQVLFRIEPDSFRAACDEALAQVKSCEAHVARTELDYGRVEKASQKNAVSQQDVSTKRADRDMAIAALMAAQATFSEAQLKLSYTDIKAPIAGRISRKMVDVGNLVGTGENTLLARLLRLDPIYVYFNVSEDILVHEIKGGKFSRLKASPIKCLIAVNGDPNYTHSGTIDYMDNSIDESTGTITLRARLDNPDEAILPGMFIRVKMAARVREDAVMVSDRAVCSDLNSKYVLVVGKDNIVERRSVELGTLVDGSRVVLRGISADETYILKGFHLARPGAPVVPVPVDAGHQLANSGVEPAK